MTERWLDKKGLAEHYSCSVRSVELLLPEGCPHVVAFGRVKFRVSEVQPFVERTGHFSRKIDCGCTVDSTHSAPASVGADPGHDREVSPDG